MIVKPSKWQPIKLLRRTSYEVTADEVVLREGIVSSTSRRIPRDRITNVDLLLRHISPGSSAVALNVSSGEQIVCDGLTKAVARELLAAINGDEAEHAEQGASAVAPA